MRVSGWAPAQLRSVLAIWGLDKKGLEDVVGRDAGRNVSKEQKIAVRHFAG